MKVGCEVNHDEFENLLDPFLDGELDSAERLAVQAYLKDHPEARERIAFEQQLRQRCREALLEPADMVTKTRLIRSLRAAAKSQDTRASRRAWLWRGVSVAAALLLVFVLSNREDRAKQVEDNSLSASAGTLIDVVSVSERHFEGELARQSKEMPCRFQCVKSCLKRLSTGPQFWNPQSDVPLKRRYEECNKLVSEVMGRPVELRCLPKDFKLVAARKAELRFQGRTLIVPHLVLMSDKDRLSVYVICGSQSEEIAKGLHKIASTKCRNSELLGCSQRGVMVKKCGEVWYVMISQMDYQKLKTVAETF